MQFYAASVLTAALTQLLVDAAARLARPTVGASGGAVRPAARLRHDVSEPHHHAAVPAHPDEGQGFVAIFGGLELLPSASTGTTVGVAHFAHLGGMLGGFLMIRYWRGQSPFGRR